MSTSDYSPLSIQRENDDTHDEPRTACAVFCCSRLTLLYVLAFLEFFGTFCSLPAVTPMLNQYFNNDFSRTNLYLGLVDGTGALLSFLTAPLFGAFSDRIGRRPFLIMSTFATVSPFMALVVCDVRATGIVLYLIFRCAFAERAGRTWWGCCLLCIAAH
jgi:MFS family permease